MTKLTSEKVQKIYIHNFLLASVFWKVWNYAVSIQWGAFVEEIFCIAILANTFGRSSH